MSGKVVGWAMEQRTGSPVAKLVLVKLADNANEEGICWPSVPLIVEHTELSDRAVRKHLRALEEAGLISVESRNNNGQQIANVYRLAVPWPASAGGSKAISKGRSTPLHDVQPPLHLVPVGPARRAAPTLHDVQGNKNRHLEPSKNPRTRERLPDGPLAVALKNAIGPGLFGSYFADAQFVEGDGKPNKLLLANEFIRSRVATRYGLQVRKVMGDDVEIDLISPSSPAADAPAPYWVER